MESSSDGPRATTLASWENVSDPETLTLAPTVRLLENYIRQFCSPHRRCICFNDEPRSGPAGELGDFYDLGLGQVATLATQSKRRDAYDRKCDRSDQRRKSIPPKLSLQAPFPGAYGFQPT